MKINNCLVTQYGITCIEQSSPNRINYIFAFCILRLYEELIKYSIINLNLFNKNISYLDGVSFS